MTDTEFKSELKRALTELGFNPEERMEVDADYAEHIVVTPDHPLLGWSIRNIMTAWHSITTTPFVIVHVRPN